MLFFDKRKGVSPLIAAVLLIAFTMAVAAILTAWIASFTQDQRDKSDEFQKKIDCAYSNIEVDAAYAKWDNDDKIFYSFVSNTGVDAITLKKAEVWVDGEKQLPIMFNSLLNLTTVDKDAYLEVYVNMSSAFESNPSGALTQVKFISECESVFDRISAPQGGWNSFEWVDQDLVN